MLQIQSALCRRHDDHFINPTLRQFPQEPNRNLRLHHYYNMFSIQHALPVFHFHSMVYTGSFVFLSDVLTKLWTIIPADFQSVGSPAFCRTAGSPLPADTRLPEQRSFRLPQQPPVHDCPRRRHTDIRFL